MTISALRVMGLACAVALPLGLGLSVSSQPAAAQEGHNGDDGDCDDRIKGDGEGIDYGYLKQIGCVHDQINNQIIIHQTELVRNVVGARLVEDRALCVNRDERDQDQPPEDRRVCTEVNGLLISPVADVITAAEQNRWNIWADGKMTWMEPGDDDLLPTQGSLFNGTLGLDYRFNDQFVAGIIGSFEASRIDTSGLFDGDTDTRGFGGGAYAGYTLADNLVINAMVTGTWVDTDNKFAGIAANIDASRLQISGGITKYWYFDQTRVTPSLQVSWSREFQGDFTDSTSTRNPRQTISSAIATASTTIGHTFALANGQSIEPWAAGNLDWTMYSEIDTKSVGTTDLGQFLDLRLQAGLNWYIAPNAQLAATAELGGLLHPDQDTYSGELNLAIQF